MLRHHSTPYIAFTLLLGAVVLIYQQGLTGGFVLDDFHNIVQNPALQGLSRTTEGLAEATLSGGAGPTGRPIAMFSFALDAWLNGLDPYWMKATNLALHCLVGLLVFLFADRLLSPITRSRWPALLAAAVWLLHPLHVSTVLYVVQRMAVLATLFGLLSLIAYLRAREAHTAGRAAAWLLLHLLAMLAAVFSKENGALLVPLVLLLEAGLLRMQSGGRPIPQLVKWYLLALSTVLLLAAVYLFIAFDSLTGGYAYREFTLKERVLTQLRVLWHYVTLMVVPVPGNFSLYKDGYALSSGFLQPVTTLISLIAWGGVLVWGLVRLTRGPSLLAFGMLWFLVGHALESTLLPIEVVFEHRNYLPSVGLFIAMAGITHTILKRVVTPPSYALLNVLAISLLAGCTFVVTSYWSDPLRHALISVEQHPRSPRANFTAGMIHFQLLQDQPSPSTPEELFRYVETAKRADHHLSIAGELAPNSVGPLAYEIMLFGHTPEETAPLLRALRKRLSGAKLRPNAGAHILVLLNCLREGKCTVDSGLLLEGIIAAANNSRARARERAAFHLLAASMLVVEFNRPEEAGNHIASARQLAPHDESVRANAEQFQAEMALRPGLIPSSPSE